MLCSRGKVRDIYYIDEKHLLIVATDRLSAFDVILPDPIPDKGRVLTHLSNFWFAKMRHILPNHLVDISLKQVLPDVNERAELTGRAVVVKQLNPLPIEAIVRGYLIGSGWKEYEKSGSVCGEQLPRGLQLADQLPAAIFTPSTKAEANSHDENISFAQTVQLIGVDLAEQVRDASLKLYTEAAIYAKTRGIIIADTKFEFGVDENNVLYLIDELLTPDSSRFWPVAGYQRGISPPSFDKQYVRDYLETLNWDKKAPAPPLPAAVAESCAAKYREAERRLTSDSSL
jgi:phosphoribosylaminoimidazole-succinocarboxamide synthase